MLSPTSRLLFSTFAALLFSLPSHAQDVGTTRTLEPGKPIERELSGGETYSYLVTLSTGQFMQAVVDQRGIDVVVTLYGPDGKKITEVDSPNGTNGPEPVSTLAKAIGDYRIEVRSLEKSAATGRYEVKVEDIRTATTKDKAADFALTLAEAQMESDRRRLLEGNKELQTDDLIVALDTLASRSVRASKHEQGIGLYRIALGLAEQRDNKPLVAVTINNLGIAYESQGDLQQALNLFQKAMVLFEELGNKQRRLLALYNMGDMLLRLGDYERALSSHLKYLAMADAIGDKSLMARVMPSLGTIYKVQGNYAKALEYYEKALTLFGELDDKGGVVIALINIGTVHSSQNNPPLALDYHQKALALLQEVMHGKLVASSRGPGRLVVFAYFDIAYDYGQLGDYTKALEFSQKTLEAAQAMGSTYQMSAALETIALVHMAQTNYDKAIETLRKALTFSETSGAKSQTARLRELIGEAYYLQGDYANSLKSELQATEFAQQQRNAERLWRSRTLGAKAYRSLGQLGQARRALEDAIVTVEELRTQVAGNEQQQQRFFEDKVSPYYEILELDISQNNVEGALSYAERAKARALLDTLRSGRIHLDKAMTADEQVRERQLAYELVSLNLQMTNGSQGEQSNGARSLDLRTRLQKARLDYEAFQTSLYAAHPQLKIQRGEAQPIKLEEVSSVLPDTKTAALEFVVTEDNTYLFVLTKTASATQAPVDARVYTLPITQKELAERTERFRRQLAQSDLEFRQSARELYDLLLKPAHDLLRGKATIVIVPDGPLWDLPFQALQQDRGRYLIEDQAVFYTPSLTVLREMMRARRKPSANSAPGSTLLAFGNPAINKQTAERVQRVLMDEKLEPLPEAERQVAALAKLYGPSQSKVYTGAEAREERAKTEASGFRILEFATHGVLNDSSPMYSHLVLSQAEGNDKEDGLLEAWEMMNLDLQADMVVLSACETARGRTAAGEGIIGMSWALFVAGAPTTVVSQWKVESASTTELMLTFHRNIKTGMQDPKLGMTKAKALQQAAIKMLRSGKYAHPFYWAGFVVVGDGF